MILANLRASAWKYGCILVAVLAVAAAVTATVFHIQNLELHRDYDAAKSERDSARAEVVSLNEARARDDTSAATTDTARAVVAEQTTQHNDRAERVEAIAHAPRPPVPDACPLPDPDLVRELAEGRGRVRAAEDRLRSVRPAASPPAR